MEDFTVSEGMKLEGNIAKKNSIKLYEKYVYPKTQGMIRYYPMCMYIYIHRKTYFKTAEHFLAM